MEYTQPALFPVEDIQTHGYAQPEPADEDINDGDPIQPYIDRGWAA